MAVVPLKFSSNKESSNTVSINSCEYYKEAYSPEDFFLCKKYEATQLMRSNEVCLLMIIAFAIGLFIGKRHL